MYSHVHPKRTIILLLLYYSHKKGHYFCPECRSYHYEDNPFVVEKKHSFTDTTSVEIMRFLREQSATFSMAAKQSHTTPTKIMDVFDTLGQMKKLNSYV